MLLIPESQRTIGRGLKQKLALVQLTVLFPLLIALPFEFSGVILFAPIWVLTVTGLRLNWSIAKGILLTIALSAAFFVFVYYGSFLGREPGVTLIALMYSLKILEAKVYRDVNLLLTLAFFVLAMNFLFTQALWSILYMLAAFVIITQGLMSANSSNAKLKDLAKSYKLIIFALPLMLLLFFFFPRLPGPLWKMPGQKTATTGMSNSMMIGDVGSMQQSDEVAFRVKFISQVDASWPKYWRAMTFEEYNGTTWWASRLRGRTPISYELQSEDVIEYQVTMEATEQPWLYALDRPITIPEQSKLYSDATLRANAKVSQRKRYRVTSSRFMFLERDLSDRFKRLNLYLPDSENVRSKRWAREQYHKIGEPLKFVEFLLKTINEKEYYYTLSPPLLRRDAIDGFWFDTRRGFCEHYASAVTVMLRAVGIPARIVVGYQGGEYNELGGNWIVRQRNAHAWLEFWQPERGWVRVDPTVAIATERIEQELWNEFDDRGLLFDELNEVQLGSRTLWETVKVWKDTVNEAWREWFVDYDMAKQNRMFDNFSVKSLLSMYFFWGLVLLAIITVTFYLYRIRSGDKGDDIARAFNQLFRLMERRGFEKHVSEGVKSYFERAGNLKPEWRSTLLDILDIYLKLRFSGRFDENKKIKQLLLKKLNAFKLSLKTESGNKRK